MPVMEVVEFYFKESEEAKEQTRKYEVEDYEDAIAQFRAEFPDDETKPAIFRIRVEHPEQKVV